MALSKDTGTPTGQGLVTILLERLFDLFTVAVLTLAIAPMIPASWARTWLVALSLLTVAVAAAFVGLARSAALQRAASRLIAKVPPLERRRQTLRTAAAALEPLRSARAAGTVLAWSFAAWAVLLASTLMVERAVVHGSSPGPAARWRWSRRRTPRRSRPPLPVSGCSRPPLAASALHLRSGVGCRARVRAHLSRV